MNDKKVYVRVTAAFSENGLLMPLSLIWEDGREYPIDRVLDIRPAAALKAGGQGDRYTIRTSGRESFLFFERSPKISDPTLGRWFVERRG
ncbi:hypothetical protein IZU99_04770 [Oscillospiraceae bacterium CM]|nr:hypothetical protein IZU99_04770 [Oscillospiraceae bacterium CM]